MNRSRIILCTFVFLILNPVQSKYVEGHLKTLDDWAFVARFCFLSGKGRYEYHIEFERRYGEPQLLLYYDDKSQWPSVYKSGKTCLQKLGVLSVADNQIVTLSARSPYNILSGCALRTSREELDPDDVRPLPPPYSTRNPDDLVGDINFTYYDQFLKTSTYSPEEQSDILNESTSSYNDTIVFNATEHFYVPVGTDIGLENEIENNTRYMEYAEELFDENTNKTKKVRIKRGFLKRDRGTLIVTCNSAGGFITSRERWWYIAISNCGIKKGIDVKYKFRMTNGPPGDFWHEHFSADEMYIPPILLAETLVYTFLLLAIFICSVELKARHLLHCTYRLFAFSAFLQYMGVLFAGVAWAKYAITGLGPYIVLGTLLQGASEVVFLALLLLMAKGYTITRARLSTCSTVKLTMFINVYIVAYISLFIYREEAFDPGEVLNLYESPAGLGLAGLRCGSWAMFLISIISTVRKFPEKATFYYPFGILGSLWILGGPILTFTGIAFFDAWVRESVMCGVLAILAISGHSSFLWITWPSRANVSFPYHVRTNHVGVMSSEDDGSDYPRHVYEQSMNEQNIIIPLSRRTEDLLNGVYNQYLQERDLYQSNSTPHSHISFPNGLNQPPQSNGDARQQDEETGIQATTIPNTRQNSSEPDNQVDSGHPSFELPKTPKTSSPSSAEDSPKTNLNQPSALKKNPFLINGVQSPPNKIILEPIRPPVQSSCSSDVPKHLFAARKSME